MHQQHIVLPTSLESQMAERTCLGDLSFLIRLHVVLLMCLLPSQGLQAKHGPNNLESLLF